MYRVDLGEEYRERRWHRLLILIDHLPGNSAFVEAIANDEEAAERWLAAHPDEDDEGDAEEYRPRFSDWSPERAELVKVLDAVRAVAAAVMASAGGKPGRQKPEPRPQSAVQRLRAARRAERRVIERADLYGLLWPQGVPDAADLTPPPDARPTGQGAASP